MPVPIAVTNPGGVGLVGHTLSSLETAGPFARLAAQKTSESNEASTIQSPAVSTGHVVAAPTTTHEAASEFSVLVNGLEFSYPGLGG